jgi:hypothetical protein
MKLIAKAVDGATFTGGSAAAIVRSMRRSHWSAPSRKQAYMQEVAERVWAARSMPVRTDPIGFLLDLNAAGVIELGVRLDVPLAELHSLQMSGVALSARTTKTREEMDAAFAALGL